MASSRQFADAGAVGLATQTSYTSVVGLLTQPNSLQTALASLHYIYPAVVFGYFVVTSSIAICILSEKKEHARRRPMLVLMLFTVLSYLAQIATIVVPSMVAKEWLGQQDTMISLLSCILVFGIQLATLFDHTAVAWYPYIGPYLLALVFEPALEIISLYTRAPGPLAPAEIARLSIAACRYLAVSLVVASYFTWRDLPSAKDAPDSEQQPLIPKNADGTPVHEDSETATEGVRPTSNYGSTASTAITTADNSDTGNSDSEDETESSRSGSSVKTAESPWERSEREKREEMEKRLKENGNWLEYAKRFMIFFPYIWPVNNRGLQIRAVLVGVCLLANNALNVLIPRQLGIIIDSLGHANDKNPWVQVVIFAVLKFAASQAGISLLRQWLWIPVEYYSFGAMSTAAYSHVLNLSSDFHDSKSSSDIMVAINSGQSISSLLESICFSAIPMLIDMAVAFFYLSASFGPYEGFITSATAVIFLYMSGRMISGLKTARRHEVNAWFEEHYVRQTGIQGWSTVVSFNQVDHEERRYSKAVSNRMQRSQNVYLGYLLAYAFQYLVLLAGLLAGAFLAVWQVTSGQSTPGQFMMMLTYWTQLVAPLTFFASLGKNISRNFIHAEQLLEIMNTKPTIVSKEGAPDLQFSGGSVEFQNVSFSYQGKKNTLKNVSFSARPGMTVAFVGATGAGKSTILKLIDRFYDATEGSIKIDGQDVRDVNLFSLRSRIGIVPQSPILFNDTIMNNVRYAKLDATDEEVFNACKAAAIHDQILGFSDGYNTRVGERGVKLSGGELQRVAIARAILKNPSIVLLDEATSSVDTETEQKIQKALQALCSGRTTFIVAHRLSTVMDADQIIVISDGEIVEEGTHDELIHAGGKYESLWSKQVFTRSPDKSKSTPSTTVTNMNPGLTVPTNDEVSKGNKKTHKEETGTGKSEQLGASDDQQGDTDDTSRTTVPPKADNQHDSGIAHDPNGSTPTDQKEDVRLNPVAPPFTPRSFFAALQASSKTGHVATDSDNTDSGLPQSTTAVHGSPAMKLGATLHGTLRSNDETDTQSTPAALASPSGRGRETSSSYVSDHSGFDGEPSKIQERSTEATEPDTSPQVTFSPEHQGSHEPDKGNSIGKASLKGKSKYNKSKWNRPRYTRRVQSRSEPLVGK